MKRLLLLLYLGTISQVSIAQTDFCLPGATWVYYDSGNSAVNYEIEDMVTYVGDTVIPPFQNVRILKTDHRYQFTPGGVQIVPLTYQIWNTYVAQRADSVFKFADDNWEFIFDFGLESGDTRLVYVEGEGCLDYDTMQVELIDTVQLFGMNLRRTQYEVLIEDQLNQMQYMPWGTVSGSYVERIGFTFDSPIGGAIHCSKAIPEYLPINLTCYADDELLNNGGEPCMTVLSIHSQAQQTKAEIIFSNQQLQTQNASKSTLHVYDMLGKELLHTSIRSDNESVDVNHLPNGILMVVVESEYGRSAKKISKTY
jgi:hypothetical protein